MKKKMLSTFQSLLMPISSVVSQVPNVGLLRILVNGLTDKAAIIYQISLAAVIT